MTGATLVMIVIACSLSVCAVILSFAVLVKTLRNGKSKTPPQGDANQ
jgi:hypothetical protein